MDDKVRALGLGFTRKSFRRTNQQGWQTRVDIGRSESVRVAWDIDLQMDGTVHHMLTISGKNWSVIADKSLVPWSTIEHWAHLLVEDHDTVLNVAMNVLVSGVRDLFYTKRGDA